MIPFGGMNAEVVRVVCHARPGRSRILSPTDDKRIKLIHKCNRRLTVIEVLRLVLQNDD